MGVISEIKQRLSITDVVSEYVPLVRKGDRQWGLCPFHKEKTPSFSVSDERGAFHCFGCGKGGSMFDFIMEIENVSFPEAVRILAAKAHVQLKPETEEEKRQRSLSENLLELYAKLVGTFRYWLEKRPEGEGARAYLDSRLMSPQTRKDYLLGYAPASPYWLHGFLLKNSYSEDFLSRSGLFSRSDPHRSLFADRIMFPIRTWQGRCVGFGGRDLTGLSRAKYLNTPETEIYKKKDLLFGLYEALPALKETKAAILCEGNFDVLSMRQAGIANTVAPLGTAFTEEQAGLLRRYCERVGVLFDSDEAGRNATRKTLAICQKAGLACSVITVRDGKDPADTLAAEGPEGLRGLCAPFLDGETPPNGFDYLVEEAIKRYDVSQPKGKFYICQEVKPFWDATSSEIERQEYIKALAQRIKISEKEILLDYSRAARRRSGQEEALEIPEARQTDSDLALMLTFVNNRALFEKSKRGFRVDLLRNDDAKKLYALLEDAGRRGIDDRDVLLQMVEEPGLRKTVSDSFVSDLYRDPKAAVHVREAIRLIKKRDLEEKKANILSIIRFAGPGTGTDELLGRIDEIDRSIKELDAAPAAFE